MTSLLQQIGRLAVRTFRREPQVPETVFNGHFEQLCNLLNRVTPEDINLDQRLLCDRGQFNAVKDGAPVTYMQVYEDSDVTICVFILKRGVRLPLHDHPGMFGLLKVIYGSVAVESYSHMASDSLDERLLEILNAKANTGVFPATKHPRSTLSASDPVCRLSPNNQNMHEIFSVDGPAAFLDILSPPYGTDKRSGLDRDCHYYQEIDSFSVPQLPNKNFALLISIPSPSDFWCDQADYVGPAIDKSPEENGS